MSVAKSSGIASLVGEVPVIPVLVIDRVDDAVPLAEALLSAGLHILEVTLRTRDALLAVTRIREALPAAIVGVGSVIQPPQFALAARAGAGFCVSPGSTSDLEAAAAAASLPWLPGVQTVSEILSLRAKGYSLMKFFPAEAVGGIDFLRSVAGPVPDVRFCPTGGISALSAREYLKLANVQCVGGSWMTPPDLVTQRRWDAIASLAREARGLR